jgi:asparagine synthase (glutamine-hydrolysing)
LDSSIIASFQKPKYTFTVNLEGHGSDKKYARLIAEKYGSTHITITIKYNELLKIEEKVIELFKTFDPIFIRNSSVIFAALQKASEMQIQHILTGDGSDELFAGYNYLKRYYLNKKELEIQVKRLWTNMSFPSMLIGDYFNISVSSPYLDEKFLEFAKSLDISLKIGKYQKKIWGKYILRKCFQNWEHLDELAWRKKEAQEEGSGFSNIGFYFENHVFSNKEYLENIRKIKETENVKIRNKEHLFYYLAYRRYFLPPMLQIDSTTNKICPDCNCSFKWSGQFCKMCGAYPVKPLTNQE